MSLTCQYFAIAATLKEKFQPFQPLNKFSGVWHIGSVTHHFSVPLSRMALLLKTVRNRANVLCHQPYANHRRCTSSMRRAHIHWSKGSCLWWRCIKHHQTWYHIAWLICVIVFCQSVSRARSKVVPFPTFATAWKEQFQDQWTLHLAYSDQTWQLQRPGLSHSSSPHRDEAACDLKNLRAWARFTQRKQVTIPDWAVD